MGVSTTVRVGIVSWNCAELLDRCLTSLPGALGGVRAEIVIVDNDSADRSASVVALHPGVRLIRNAANVGYARAMNRALASDAPVLIALNPDTEPAPGSLARLVSALEADPEAGMVVPRLTNPDGSLQHSVYRFPGLGEAMVTAFVPHFARQGPIGRHWWLVGAAPHDRRTAIDWAMGAVHVIRAEALGGRRPYCERWFMYSEDLDLCWRLHQSGWKVVLEPNVTVTHVGNASGQRAWDDAERDLLVLQNLYDWYAHARGEFQARTWAGVNTVGALVKLTILAPATAVTGDPGLAQWRDRFRWLVAIHGRALVKGPASFRPDGHR